ncbi:MAG: hypothetical protein MZU97_03805 [Bacillus subtilis]|nr:hypothetical protein [Bacillus subtilis]
MADVRRRKTAVDRDGAIRADSTEKDIVVLYNIAGLNHREIAQVLDKPLGTITCFYAKSLKKMRQDHKGGGRMKLHRFLQVFRAKGTPRCHRRGNPIFLIDVSRPPQYRPNADFRFTSRDESIRLIDRFVLGRRRIGCKQRPSPR